MPSLGNWDSGLKIFCGLHTSTVGVLVFFGLCVCVEHLTGSSCQFYTTQELGHPDQAVAIQKVIAACGPPPTVSEASTSLAVAL